jgi:hypothetical protein
MWVEGIAEFLPAAYLGASLPPGRYMAEGSLTALT